MSATQTVWRGAIAFSSEPCDECGEYVSVLFQLDRASAASRWACRACVLDPARNVGAVDRRGDTLRTAEQIANEMDLRAAIALRAEARDRERRRTPAGIDYGPVPECPPVPADYIHVLAVLGRLSREDSETGSTIAELCARYETAACFSPRQMLFVQWRLAKLGVEHQPHCFAMSLRSEKELAQLRGFDGWRRKKIAPYLSWEQRSKFGF